MTASDGDILPANLASLHASEEQLRDKALALIMADDRLRLPLAVTEASMDLADILRRFSPKWDVLPSRLARSSISSP